MSGGRSDLEAKFLTTNEESEKSRGLHVSFYLRPACQAHRWNRLNSHQGKVVSEIEQLSRLIAVRKW